MWGNTWHLATRGAPFGHHQGAHRTPGRAQRTVSMPCRRTRGTGSAAALHQGTMQANMGRMVTCGAPSGRQAGAHVREGCRGMEGWREGGREGGREGRGRGREGEGNNWKSWMAFQVIPRIGRLRGEGGQGQRNREAEQQVGTDPWLEACVYACTRLLSMAMHAYARLHPDTPHACVRLDWEMAHASDEDWLSASL